MTNSLPLDNSPTTEILVNRVKRTHQGERWRGIQGMSKGMSKRRAKEIEKQFGLKSGKRHNDARAELALVLLVERVGAKKTRQLVETSDAAFYKRCSRGKQYLRYIEDGELPMPDWDY